MNSSTQRVIALALVVAVGGGCEIERFFPKDVGSGAARLTVRNAVKVLALLDADSNCGFSSSAVKTGYTQQGDVGDVGSVTWTVSACTLDFGPTLVPGGAPSTDCNGEKTTVSGKLTASATRTVQGLLTGNPDNPVIPQSPDAVTIAVQADVVDYNVRLSDKTTGLTMHSGHLEETASIHLADSISLGVCAIPTSDVTLNSIKVTGAKYTLDDSGNIFDVDVPSLEEKAQLGVYGKFENFVQGKITVWDTEVSLDDNHVLDPDYKTEDFARSFQCTPDLQLPVSFQCGSLVPKLADGAAKLTVNDVGNVVQAAVADTNCGFASQAVTSSAQITGTVGQEGGEVVYQVQNCPLDFGTQTQVARDCVGKTTFASGKATFSGTMRVKGRLSGDPTQPVIPLTRDPATITFHVDFDNFDVTDSVTTQSMKIVSGAIDGTMAPRMAQDSTTQACSIPTPVVTFSGLSWSAGTKALISAEGNTLGITIDASELDAQNGNKDGVENKLAGTITVNGDTFGIPENGAPQLDPNYDPQAFMDSFACTPNMVIPTSDDQCNFHQVIGDGAARLVVQTVGTLATLINNDTNCGFSDKLGVEIFPTSVVGSVGDMGSMTWDVSGCTVGSDQLADLSDDCNGGSTFYQGSADVTAERTVTGLRDTQFLVIDSIEPASDQSVTILLENVPLSEFVTYQLAAGQTEPQGQLIIHDGTLSATVQPATGAEASNPSVFDVPTPVAQMSDIHLQNAHATLLAQGKEFDITITDASLSAVNGSLNGVTNMIQGDIVVDGNDIQIGGGLNPQFDQRSFDSSYACTDNLQSVIQ